MSDDSNERDDGLEAAKPQPESPSTEPAKPAPPAEPTPEDLRSISEEISSQYPPPRLGTELVLLEVDPHRAHAYWNVDIQDYEEARFLAGVGSHPLVLRMHDITDEVYGGPGGDRTFDIEVQGLQSHWYIDLWQSGRTFVAELGFRKEDGSLVSITRSNTVETPRASESSEYNTVALHTGRETDHGPLVTDLLTHHDHDHDDDVLDVVQEHAGEPVSHADVPVTDVPSPVLPVLASDLPVPDAAGEAAVVDDREFPLMDRTLPQAEVVLDPHPGAETPERPALVRVDDAKLPPMGPAQHTEDAPHEFWPAAEAAAKAVADVHEKVDAYYAEFSSPDSAISQAQREAEKDAGHVADESEPQLVPPPEAAMESGEAPATAQATDDAPAPAPTGESPRAPLPLESYVNLSSFDVGKPEVQLEINTEIHIYGRAKPGTELTLYGQKVLTRPDGTFSIRKPLPQGAIVLPLLFTSNGGAPHREGG